MKNMLTLLVLGMTLSSAAHALDWQCGKKIELQRIPDTDSVRPSLLVNTREGKDGRIIKSFKPLGAANESVADFLSGIDGDTTVCLKYFDPILPAPVPLLILDIKAD